MLNIFSHRERWHINSWQGINGSYRYSAVVCKYVCVYVCLSHPCKTHVKLIQRKSIQNLRRSPLPNVLQSWFQDRQKDRDGRWQLSSKDLWLVLYCVEITQFLWHTRVWHRLSVQTLDCKDTAQGCTLINLARVNLPLGAFSDKDVIADWIAFFFSLQLKSIQKLETTWESEVGCLLT